MKIAIIDTGIDDLLKKDYYTYEYIVDKNNEIVESKAKDYNGHGTSIVNVIHKINPEAELYIYRLSEDIESIELETLIKILDYILNVKNVDIINISCGVTYIDDYHSLKNVCDALFDKGIMIVSAYDNEGAISYPAAYKSVIGVETSNDFSLKSINIKENSSDLIVPLKYYRTICLNNIKTIMTGTSFACAEITGCLSKYLDNKPNVKNYFNFKDVLDKLFIEDSKKNNEFAPQFNYKKAIAIFHNKETDVLIRNKENLTFELAGVFDVAIKGNIGKNINNITIEDINKINWEDDFDTVILSHSKEFELLSGKSMINDLLEKAINYKKNVYSFDEITNVSNKNLFFPQVKTYPILTSRLKKITIPCVGIVGTSSKQGKFTLQLEIIKNLKNRGYKVGSIMTEPSGYLFGADFTFPIGYNSTVNINLYEYIYCLNEQLFNIETQNKDIVICTSQSGTIHYDVSNLNQYTISQHGFLLGTNPDIYILCVNPFDEIEYIKRSISYLNSLYEGKVIAIALLPLNKEFTQNGILLKIVTMTNDEMDEIKRKLSKSLNLPCYIIGTNDINSLVNEIIENFEEE